MGEVAESHPLTRGMVVHQQNDRLCEGVETALALDVLSSRLGPATKLLCDLEQITSPLWISLAIKERG